MLYIPEANISNILLITSLSIGVTVLVHRELSPKTQLAYSKFSKPGKETNSLKMSSRKGMFLIYGSSLVTSALELWLGNAQQKNTKVMMSLLVLHYMKRVYEVLCVHHYSGSMNLVDGLFIAFCYAASSPLLRYMANQVPANFDPSWLMTGLVLFTVGEAINYYHHNILASLRGNGLKEYKIPQGGLFQYIWCPHYLGEIISFGGIASSSLNIMTFIYVVMVMGYLGARSYQTRIWYQQKFKMLPSRHCLIPGLF